MGRLNLHILQLADRFMCQAFRAWFASIRLCQVSTHQLGKYVFAASHVLHRIDRGSRERIANALLISIGFGLLP